LSRGRVAEERIDARDGLRSRVLRTGSGSGSLRRPAARSGGDAQAGGRDVVGPSSTTVSRPFAQYTSRWWMTASASATDISLPASWDSAPNAPPCEGNVRNRSGTEVDSVRDGHPWPGAEKPPETGCARSFSGIAQMPASMLLADGHKLVVAQLVRRFSSTARARRSSSRSVRAISSRWPGCRPAEPNGCPPLLLVGGDLREEA